MSTSKKQNNRNEDNDGGIISFQRVYTDKETGETKRDLFWEKAAAEEDDISALMELGRTYHFGDGVEKDEEKAFGYFLRAAELGEPTAEFNTGLHYAQGTGVERNFKKAEEWMKKAMDDGDEDAPRLLEKLNGLAEKEELAKAGDAQGQAEFAEVLMGLGGNYTESVEWAEKSAAQGNTDGMYILGLSYDKGRGVEKDYSKSYALYKKAAELGHAPSQWNLACYYFTGQYVETDQETAFQWAMKAAQQGNVLAMAGVGHAYEEGAGVEPDLDKAIEWYEKTLQADPDNVNVQHALALAYLTPGEEGDREALQKAMYWFKKAGENGDDMCEKQYILWTYVMEKNDGLIPKDFEFGEFVDELNEKAENGDAEAQHVLEECFDGMPGGDFDDDDDGSPDQLMNKYIGKAIEDGKLMPDSDIGDFISALQDYAEEGDEGAQMLLEMFNGGAGE